MFAFEQIILKLLELCAVSLLGGVALAVGLRVGERRWTWASLGFPLAWVLAGVSPLFAGMDGAATIVGCFVGMVWHAADLAEGADRAEAARARLGIVDAVRGAVERRRVDVAGCIHDGQLTVGNTRRRWEGVPRVDTGRAVRLQPLRVWHRHRDSRQGAFGGGVYRAPLPAPDTELSRARREGDAGGADPGDAGDVDGADGS